MRINLIAFTSCWITVGDFIEFQDYHPPLLCKRYTSNPSGKEEELEIVWNDDDTVSFLTYGYEAQDGARVRMYLRDDEGYIVIGGDNGKPPQTNEKFKINFHDFGEKCHIISLASDCWLGLGSYPKSHELTAIATLPGFCEEFKVIWLDKRPANLETRDSTKQANTQ